MLYLLQADLVLLTALRLMFVALEHCKSPGAIEPSYKEKVKIDGNFIREIN